MMNEVVDSKKVKSDSNQQHESYSCSRCRRLKKKCSKEVSSCYSCQRAGEECDYPGRAPRRTKRELDEARRRGEFVPVKRTKKGAKWDTSDSLAVSSVCCSLSDSMHQGAPLSRSSSDGNLRNNGQGDISSNIHNCSGLASESASAFMASSFLNNLTSIGSTHSPVQNVAYSLTQKEVFKQGKLEHESHRPDSIPVKASNIQIEAISAIFKGGRHSPMIKEDGTCKPIDRSLCDRYIAAYFKHNHRSYPVINKLEFLNDVSLIREFKAMESKYEDTFIFQLYMIMAIGWTTLQRAGLLEKEEEENLSEHFSYLAMRKFCNVMHLQNEETAKCLLLLGIYSFFEPRGISSWTISGLLMRLTIGLGLNRVLTTKKLKNMSLIDVEMRYRAFWSYYAFERLVQTSLGRTSAIEDDDINVPFPRAMYEEEREDIEVTKMMLRLRMVAGKVYKQVHSVSAGKKKLSITEKQTIINDLRKEIDELYEKEKNRIRQINGAEHHNISFHTSETWLSMRYSQLQAMLYRPSALIPKPPMESLSLLGSFCLQALKHTYCLYKKKMLPLNWITLFRTLAVCNTILYCLCQWYIDFIESKIEIQQCVEILQHFGEKWIFAKECADVFQTISNAVLDISLSSGQVANMDKLTRELFGASNEYQDILDENNVDISWVELSI